jgi:hypothetical protein
MSLEVCLLKGVPLDGNVSRVARTVHGMEQSFPGMAFIRVAANPTITVNRI